MNGCIFTILGVHGQESPEAILERKMNDIRNYGFTMWAFKSNKASPRRVQELAAFAESMVARLFWPVVAGGAKDIKESQSAGSFSSNGTMWRPIEGISSVGANLSKGPAYALVFKSLGLSSEVVDLGAFSEYPSGKVVDIRSYFSTVAAVDKPSGFPKQRRMAAIGELTAPWCVWIRQ